MLSVHLFLCIEGLRHWAGVCRRPATRSLSLSRRPRFAVDASGVPCADSPVPYGALCGPWLAGSGALPNHPDGATGQQQWPRLHEYGEHLEASKELKPTNASQKIIHRKWI